MNEEVMIPKSYHDKVCEEIIRFKDKQFYDAVHLLDDGTLEITVGDYTKVKRVLVEDCNNFGNLFYENDTDRPQGEWILLEPRYPIEQKVYWNKEQALADTKGNGAIERRKCSCCGYAKSFMCHMKDEQIKLWNFCPNCGCRMKGADDE